MTTDRGNLRQERFIVVPVRGYQSTAYKKVWKRSSLMSPEACSEIFSHVTDQEAKVKSEREASGNFQGPIPTHTTSRSKVPLLKAP